MNKGFTLLEYLIYIGLVAVILVVVGSFGLDIFSGKAKLAVVKEVSQNARFSLENISQRVHDAEAINSPLPQSSDVILSLKMADVSIDPTIFDLSNGVLRIKEGSSDFVNLTSQDVIVSALEFLNISYPDAPGAVRIRMIVEFNNGTTRQEYQFSETFYATANIYR